MRGLRTEELKAKRSQSFVQTSLQTPQLRADRLDAEFEEVKDKDQDRKAS